MQASNSPDKISLPFAESGSKQTIPVDSQIGIEDGRASYTDGFPPVTRTPIAAGGVPPFGTDFNGLFYAITNLLRWQNAGGTYTYDAALSTAIGGYPAGSLLLKADGTGLWFSEADDNTSDPDSAGADWGAFGPLATAAEAIAGTREDLSVSPAGLAAAMLGGTSQSWQDVTASRSLGVTYTNSTGLPIIISVSCQIQPNSSADLMVNGSTRARYARTSATTGVDTYALTTAVPDGATYRISVSGTVAVLSNLWQELR